MANENNAINIDDLLDGTLDDLADAPSFQPFPAGAHNVKISWKIKTIADMPAVELSLTYLAPVELNDPEVTPPKAGDESSTAFMLKKKDKDSGQVVTNDMGQGQWKALLAMLKTDLNLDESASNRQVMEATEGMEVLAVTAVRIDKRDKDNHKHYLEVKSLNAI